MPLRRAAATYLCRISPGRPAVATYRRHASPRSGSWQYSAKMHPQSAGRGIIPPRCVFGRSPMAKYSRNTFPRRPTVARSRRDAFSGCRPWQDIAVVRFRGSSRGEIMPWCVPGRRSMAAFSLHAFPKGASDGKSASSRQHITAMHPKRAGFGEICAPCIRKAPQTGVRGCTARIPCHEGAPFAARAPQIMHGAQILPSFGVWTGKNRAKPNNCRHFGKNTFKSSH